MKRFRLSTLMLVIVIAALSVALVVRERRAARHEAELQARLAQSWPLFVQQQKLADAERKMRGEIRVRLHRRLAELNERLAELNEDLDLRDVSSATFLRLLPAANLRGNHRYVAENAFGYSFLSEVFTADYEDGTVAWQGFLRPYRDKAEAKAVLEKYVNGVKQEGAEVRPLQADGADEIVLSTNVGLFDVVFRKGNALAGASGATDAKSAEAFAREFARTLPPAVPNLPSGND